MRKIFHNKLYEEHFRKYGYVVTSFLSSGEVEQLKAIYEQYGDKRSRGFYLTLWDNQNVELRRQIHQLLQPVLFPKIQTMLVDCKTLINCFAVKNSAPASSWPVHQDDTFTDESQFVSLSVWIPLTDVDEHNGAMKVLEGSHLEYKVPRSPTIPKPFAGQEAYLLGKMRTIGMKAGQALFFSHALLHASGDNLSGQPRIAAVSVLLPQEAPVWFYYMKDDRVEIIELDDAYYQRFQLGKRPEGKVVATLSSEQLAGIAPSLKQ
ncbi:MAG: hypothetical protein KatS3mg031_1998 [Chitinophagales bacterium]|nr:MAG: hypothetical protein KatS3mg031_1998 [Chitinophagales bacterium]